MDRAERNKILGRRRRRRSEEGNSKKGFCEENRTGKTAGSNRQDQSISITPLAGHFLTGFTGGGFWQTGNGNELLMGRLSASTTLMDLPVTEAAPVFLDTNLG